MKRDPRHPPSTAESAHPPCSGTFARIQLVHTTDFDEARQAFRDIYADSILEPEQPGPFRWALDLIPCGTVSLTEGTWSKAVRAVTSAGSRKHVLVFSGGGGSGGELGGQSFSLAPGRSGAMISPEMPGTIRGSEGHVGQNFIIEPSALGAHLTALTGREPSAPIVFDVAVDLEKDPGAALFAVAELLRREVERPEGSPLLAASLRDALLTALLTGVKHSASHLLEPGGPRVAPACVKRAKEYMAAHVLEPITLAGIAAAAGVPARSLRAAFTASEGVSPMAFLRRRRYELARRRLMEAEPGTRVASVVKALGLGDAGRFSVEFKRRFGQSPSEVLAAGRAGAGPAALKGRRG